MIVIDLGTSAQPSPARTSASIVGTCDASWLTDRSTPIIIGYILHATGSFNGALVFVGLNAFVAMAAYLFVVGDIKRVELKR